MTADQSQLYVVDPWSQAASWCDAHAVSLADCGCSIADVVDDRFTAVCLADIEARQVEWLVPGVLPKSELVILVGEEGIGKGLWWVHLTAQLTRGASPIPVLIIASEDDPERALRPRLDAAGADVNLVHILVADRESLTGNPLLPTHEDNVVRALESTGAQLLIIDPWISTVPGALNVRDTQQARLVLDPMTRLARRQGITVLAIAHTNRTTSGTPRDRVGLTAALRQTCRQMLLAIADPENDAGLWVGVEKSNLGEKPPASAFTKVRTDTSMKLEPLMSIGHNPLTIAELDTTFRATTDGRSTDKWAQILEAADDGVITRTAIVELYEDSPNPANAANKAINRWLNSEPPRLRRVHVGTFEVVR